MQYIVFLKWLLNHGYSRYNYVKTSTHYSKYIYKPPVATKLYGRQLDLDYSKYTLPSFYVGDSFPKKKSIR